MAHELSITGMLKSNSFLAAFLQFYDISVDFANFKEIVGEMNLSKSGEIGVTSFLSLWHMLSRVYQARDFQNQKFRNDRWSNGGKKAAAHPGIQHTNGSRDGINAAYVLF